MFSTIRDFQDQFNVEREATGKIFSVLTDENLSQEICEGFRNLGRLAWHIVQTLPEMGGKVGLKVDGPSEILCRGYASRVTRLDDPVPLRF